MSKFILSGGHIDLLLYRLKRTHFPHKIFTTSTTYYEIVMSSGLYGQTIPSMYFHWPKRCNIFGRVTVLNWHKGK